MVHMYRQVKKLPVSCRNARAEKVPSLLRIFRKNILAVYSCLTYARRPFNSKPHTCILNVFSVLHHVYIEDFFINIQVSLIQATGEHGHEQTL